MADPSPCFVGIDVGGARKGFHAVALRRGVLESCPKTDLASILAWVRELRPAAIAIDAPCHWAREGGSRSCERSLRIGDERISCFSTPTAERAAGRSFYDWVRNGLRLYAALAPDYPLHGGGPVRTPRMCETFPQAVACHLAGRKVSARHKSPVRRRILHEAGYDPSGLSNIDWIDAALCAIAAESLVAGGCQAFGDPADGLIVVPLKPLASAAKRTGI